MDATPPLEGELKNSEQVPTGVPPQRLASLDFFRGATIAAMILVNNPGDAATTYSPLEHAKWNGWTPTDLIFPFFLFIVGVSMAFSFASRMKCGQSNRRLTKHVLWRGMVFFGLGIFLNGFPNHYDHNLRIYGVLQRIAICYVISALLVMWSGRRTQVYVIAACIAGYWAVMRFVPVPGFGVPDRDIPFLDPDRNLAAWLDRKLLFGHLYDTTRDPEGLLSTVPAVATCLLGLHAGEWLRSKRTKLAKLRGLLLFGIATAVSGEIVNVWFPINKNLWTSSFVLLTAGLALVALAAFYWVLDIEEWHGGWSKPFHVFGMNAIATYVFAEAISDAMNRIYLPNGMSWEDVIYQSVFADVASPKNASLLYAIAFTCMCWLATWILYRKRIFLKV